MNKLTRFLLIQIIIALIAIISSCEYQPTGGEFTDIDSNYTRPEIIITLSDDTSSIVIASGERYIFKYKITGDLSKFKNVHFSLGTSGVFSSDESESSFALQKIIETDFEDCKLRMFVTNSTGTGSLADKLKLEKSVIVKEWNVHIYKIGPFKADTSFYENINETLKINWNKYPYENFLKYEIFKRVNGSNSNDYPIATITDINKNYVYDDNYIGEDATYYISVFYGNKNSINSLQYPKVNKGKEYPIITYKKLSYSSIELSWKKSKYHNNLKGYFFTNKEIMNDITIENPNTNTCIVEDLSVGLIDKIKFYLLPQKLTYSNIELNQDSRYFLVPINTGDSSFQYIRIGVTPTEHLIYWQSSDGSGYSLNKYSLQSGKIEQKISIKVKIDYDKGVDFSPSGKNFVFKSIIGANNCISYCIDGDLNNIKSISYIELTGIDSYSSTDEIAISDNGIIAFYLSNQIYIYDTNLNKLITSFVESVNELDISADGDYIAVTGIQNHKYKSIIYRIYSNAFNLIKDDFVGGHFEFDPENNNRLFYWDSDTRRINSLNCLNNSVSNISPVQYYFSQINFKDGLILCSQKSGEMEIRTLNNFELIFKYNVKNGWGFINNNVIYFWNGLKCSY
ncbi:MAG: hypothetical protein RO257_12430 [Candidatus Kapabacteria bacterium]|nr:hypothetical protein [Candidatus Kapabacteria bacterium]